MSIKTTEKCSFSESKRCVFVHGFQKADTENERDKSEFRFIIINAIFSDRMLIIIDNE